MTFRLIQADCIEAMAEMDQASVDAIVTDPPYGLEFMGKEWDRLGENAAGYTERPRMTDDHMGKGFKSLPNFYMAGPQSQAWHLRWATAALRVLKPGGHLLAFGGTRTYHRLTCALEDAGFEIRDCLAWLYGSGFPKSLDVSKAIDKANGAEREVVGVTRKGMVPGASTLVGNYDPREPADITAPATPEAERWQGWGTALKPAFEPIVLARKPLIGTVAANVLEHGTGALNIDGTRIEHGEVLQGGTGTSGKHEGWDRPWMHDGSEREPFRSTVGRWPPNVLLDEGAAGMLDEQSGETSGRVGMSQHASSGFGAFPRTDRSTLIDGTPDSGGASRFFYVPKADREERNRGLYGMSVHHCKVTPWDGSGTPKEPQPRRDTDEDIGEAGSGSSITGSGSRPTDPSPTATRSTISTGTRPTTDSPTLNFSPPPSTSADTLPTSASSREPGSDAAGSAESGSQPPPSTSTYLERDGSSMDDADHATSPESSATSAAEERCPDCGEVVSRRVGNLHPT